MGKKSDSKTWQILRRFPLIFAAFACLGIGVGYCFIFIFHDNNRAKENVMHVLGIVCLVFYSGTLIFWISKMINKSWPAFCDRMIDFENQRMFKRMRSGRELKVKGRSLFVLSLVVLAIAVLDNYMPLSNWRGINAAASCFVIFLGPTFFLLAVWDIFKSCFEWSRLMALICSAFATCLVIIKMDKIIHLTQ
jgi:hypothetical protein